MNKQYVYIVLQATGFVTDCVYTVYSNMVIWFAVKLQERDTIREHERAVDGI